MHFHLIAGLTNLLEIAEQRNIPYLKEQIETLSVFFNIEEL